MLSQHIRTTGARLGKRVVQSASVCGKRPGQIRLIEDKRSFHASLCTRWSSYLPHLFCLLQSVPPVPSLYSPATRYIETCTWHRVHAVMFPCVISQAVLRTDPRPLGRIKVHFKDSKGNPLKTIEGNEGDSLPDMENSYDIDLEGVYARIH